jgi:hypothetical protein
MSDLSAVCAYCSTDINSVFVTGPRTTVTISGQQIVTDPCFVADEIIFTGQGQLIFQIMPVNVRQEGPVDCAVICRKLTVQGGGQPINLNPCNPGDPGTRYNNTNLITYAERLSPIPAAGPISPPNAAPGATPGAVGTTGVQGNPGTSGGHGLTGTLTVVALEVNVASGGNLVMDWAGEDGGDGGPGQNGGNGAKGATGNNGSDASWPSSGCDTATGNGGTGGDGGPGGPGGTGGQGGNANPLIVISTPANLSGVFSDSSKITFVTQSVGGNGGKGGHGGGAGAGGDPGHPSSSCGAGSKGDPGNSLIGVTANAGLPGPPGTSLPRKFDVIDTSGSCSSLLPIPLQLPAASALPLQTFIRCFSGSASGDLSVIGQDLDQVASVSTSLTGVTASIKNSSTDTELDLSIAVAANSALGTGDLIFTYTFPPGKTQTLSGAIVVEACTATSISPTSGAQGAAPFTVTITGTGFDPTATNHNVSVSGLGVNVSNVAVVDDQHMTCTFEVDATASKTTRDVTVTAGSGLGPCSYTLVQSFTVT